MSPPASASDSLFGDDPVPGTPPPSQAGVVAPAWLDESLFKLGRQLPRQRLPRHVVVELSGLAGHRLLAPVHRSAARAARTRGVLAAPGAANGRDRPQLLPAARRRRVRAVRESGAGRLPLPREGAVAGERRGRTPRTRRAGRRQPELPRRRRGGRSLRRPSARRPRRARRAARVPDAAVAARVDPGRRRSRDDRTHRHDARPACRAT